MRMYETYKQVVDITMRLPKRWRYGLGVSIEQSTLDCLSELIMAKNAPKQLKSAYLIKASGHLEITTLKLRLILEHDLANKTKIFQIQASLSEVGRMLGGWLKSLQST
ncbi:four helix bundle protein [Candidatus Woesebacteria bacterium]|nr:four helix bundle protein [Candidatus Woesebacteria bacterium]